MAVKVAPSHLIEVVTVGRHVALHLARAFVAVVLLEKLGVLAGNRPLLEQQHVHLRIDRVAGLRIGSVDRARDVIQDQELPACANEIDRPTRNGGRRARPDPSCRDLERALEPDAEECGRDHGAQR